MARTWPENVRATIRANKIASMRFLAFIAILLASQEKWFLADEKENLSLHGPNLNI